MCTIRSQERLIDTTPRSTVKSGRFPIVCIISLVLSSCLPIEETPPQSTPQNLVEWIPNIQITASGISTNGKINIAWRPVSHKSTYSVFRATDNEPDFKLIGQVPETSFADQDVSPNIRYQYKIAASAEPISPNFELPAETDEHSVASSFSSCLSREVIHDLKVHTDLGELRSHLRSLFESCRSDIQQKIPIPLSEDELMMVFVTIVSHGSAPYGPSTTRELFEALHEDYLDCDNYAWLAGNLYEVLRGSGYLEKIVYLGFDGGAVGNHAQVLFRSSSNRELLLDPTVGLIVFIDYDSLIHGQPIRAQDIYSFYSYWTHPLQDRWISDIYYWRVFDALNLGLYLPEDYLYYRVRSNEDLLNTSVQNAIELRN